LTIYSIDANHDIDVEGRLVFDQEIAYFFAHEVGRFEGSEVT